MGTRHARYVMIGGFLGAGKTTAVAELAKRLSAQGLRVGLITNDQSAGLVDTAILRNRGFDVEEIAGGCFCCRFQALSEAADRLTENTRPDVFIAEPVGSCTDLVATVSYPLRRIYGDQFRIAPLSVMVDAARARRVLALTEGRSFSEKVVYVYEKQLEEASVIVVNKCDRHEPADIDQLVARLEERYPRADVIRVSALEGTGLDVWFDHVLSEDESVMATMPLDYRRYAEGEALLGWFNATAALSSDSEFNANEVLLELTGELRRRLEGIEIAHLKMTLDSPGAGGQLAALSMTSSESEADVREVLLDGVRCGELIVNLRAEGDPESLARSVRVALRYLQDKTPGLTIDVQHEESFRPAPPTPTHRDSVESVGGAS